MATFQEVKAQAQRGNTGAIAALLNYTLKKDNLQAKVTATDSCLAVHLRGQQAPDSDLVPRLKKSLDQLAIPKFEHLEVSAYQVGQAEVLWTSRAPLTPVAAPPAAAPLPPAQPKVTVTASTASRSQAHQGPFTLLGRDLPDNPWLKRIAGLVAIPLLVINSVQFMLLTQTQLFGLSGLSGGGWANPMTYERIDNIFVYFVYFGRGYLWYGSLILLGALAARYAFYPRLQRANWVVLGLATIPTMLWLVGILTDPLLHFSKSDIYFSLSSAPPIFLHPTMGENPAGWQNFTLWKKWTLIAFDLALLGGLVRLWIVQILRVRRQAGTNDRPSEPPKGKPQRRATQVMAIVAVMLLLVMNPSLHQHAKSRTLRDFANPMQPRSRADLAKSTERLEKQFTYRTALFFSWANNGNGGGKTFGILGRVYFFRLKPSSDKFPNRLDVFNPFSEFRQQPND